MITYEFNMDAKNHTNKKSSFKVIIFGYILLQTDKML